MAAKCSKFRHFCRLLLRPLSTPDRQLIFILVIPILTFFIVSTLQLVDTKREMEELDLLIQFTTKISNVMHETQKERGNTGVFAVSEGKRFADNMLNQRDVTNMFRNDLLEFITTSEHKISGCSCAALQSVLESSELKSFMTMLKGLDKHRDLVLLLRLNAADAVAYYTRMHHEAFETFARIQQRTQHPEMKNLLMNYYLFANAKETFGLERMVGAKTFSAGVWASASQLRSYVELTAAATTHLQTFRTFAPAAHLRYFDETMDPSLKVVADTAAMQEMLLSNSDAIRTVHPDWWFGNMTSKINLLHQMETYMTDDLQSKVDDLQQAAVQRMILFLCLLVLSLVIIGTFTIRLFMAVRRMQRDVEAAHEIAEAISKMHIRELSSTLPPNASGLQTVMNKVVIVVQKFLPYLPETALAVTYSMEGASFDEPDNDDDNVGSGVATAVQHSAVDTDSSVQATDALEAHSSASSSVRSTEDSSGHRGSVSSQNFRISRSPFYPNSKLIPRRGISMMVADMLGFNLTTLQKDPNLSVVHTAYITRLEAHIKRNKGLMLPFQGDKVIGCWNAMTHLSNHTAHAARAALACRTEVRVLQDRFSKFPPVGVGVTAGSIRVGNMGSFTTQVFTLLGPVMNSGLFLAKLNGRLGTKILVSPAVMAACAYRFSFRLVDRVEFGGSDTMTKTGSPFDVHELLEELHETGAEGEWLYHVTPTHKKCGYIAALDHFFHHRLDDAITALRAHLGAHSEDEVATSLLRRMITIEHRTDPDINDSGTCANEESYYVRRWRGWDDGQWVDPKELDLSPATPRSPDNLSPATPRSPDDLSPATPRSPDGEANH
eukprot:NODE_50_length_2731_cov_233.573826_g44_i0.p1 GENE.NODE_50_length_2731_cov_233.573826_g44_i0~~NODE_50_length_2731_cov_233.573826_g44_i0.p1  ORF type:complete len:852 (-),score=194.80 NODE_50_length_2731_cov_233.573826_g44_i0:175-2676(-)